MIDVTVIVWLVLTFGIHSVVKKMGEKGNYYL